VVDAMFSFLFGSNQGHHQPVSVQGHQRNRFTGDSKE
jgi:hypothetical protein